MTFIVYFYVKIISYSISIPLQDIENMVGVLSRLNEKTNPYRVFERVRGVNSQWVSRNNFQNIPATSTTHMPGELQPLP